MPDDRPSPGTIAWIDLTVPDADAIRDFYEQVTGWRSEPVEMGEYSDFNMLPPGGEAVAGVCHARGANESMPPVWMVYIVVADLDGALRRCLELGGEVVVPIRRGESWGGMCVIRDPAGAMVALYAPAPPTV